MTCNCDNDGSNEYIIELNQQGAPGVKGEQGEQGYSPVVDYTSDNNALQLHIVNEQNTVTTPEIPLKSYTDTQLAGKLNTNGSNADNSLNMNRLTIQNNRTNGARIGTRYTDSTEKMSLTISGYPLQLDGGAFGSIAHPNTIKISESGSSISIGNSNENMIVIDNTSARYNNKEIATVDQIPTVGNGTITLTQGGVTKGTFTTNQSGNTTIALDSGASNPLEIKTSDGTRVLSLGVDNSTKKADIYYGIVREGSTFAVPILPICQVASPLVATDNGAGLYSLSVNTMTGCDSITGGASGLVPAPSAGDQDKFLKGDGTWDTVGGGGSSYTAGTGIDITNDTISVDSTVVALQSDLPTNYLTTNTSQTITTGTKTMANGTSQVFVSGSSLDVRGKDTLFIRGATQAQGGYLGLSSRSRDTVNNVAINVIRLQANTNGDLANLRLQGYDLYDYPYLYNGFTRLGRVSVSSGDINITTESGVELQYNGYKVATVNDIPTSNEIEAHKAYLADGDTLTDPQGLEDVKYYNKSSFDLSKFTIVGSPTITDDGIASGFSRSNYVIKDTIINPNIIRGSFTVNSKTSSESGFIFQIAGVANSTLNLFKASTGYIQMYQGDSYINYVTASSYEIGIPIYYEIGISGTTVTLKLIQNNNVIAEKTGEVVNNVSGTIVIGRNFDGSIDLKQFSITVDGKEVFNGNKEGIDTYTIGGNTVSVPYTLSKTGSKIVDSSYRAEVQAVYNQQGYAPYYTLDETNGNFTLPMGEIYGYITRLEGIVKDLQTRLSALESNINGGGASEPVQQNLLGMSPLSLNRPQLLGELTPIDGLDTIDIEPTEEEIPQEEVEPQPIENEVAQEEVEEEPQETEEETEEGGQDE